MLPRSSEETGSLVPMGLTCPHFPVSEIQLATQNFNEELLIGQGGFGKVYKGTMNYYGTKMFVAIKRLDSTSPQGAMEFWAEVQMVSTLRHCNLVSLIGYCNDYKEMILVYEYMPNGTLADNLHKLHTPFSFSQRLKICIGAARGLQYLHTGTGTRQGIIHRDVKSSNILLDNNWAAKVSDFGLSKISPTDKPSTGVNTLIKGTFGYFDPEYFATGRLTMKSDVFSFGVILLEVLCRKRAVDNSLDEEQWSLVGWAQDFLKGGKLKKIIDPDLKGNISLKCLNNYAKLVDGCLHSRPKLRITMAEVVYDLESILALHEKNDDSILVKGLISYGRKFQKYFYSSKENPGNNNNNNGMPNPRPSNTPADVLGELVANGWPRWLAAVSGEAIKGWLPRRADTFEKLDKIGQGSYSSVYKGRDTHTGKIVALKKIMCDPLDPERVKMVAMEIVILRHLDHPNVIKLEGIVTSRMSMSLYLVFEYLDHDLAALSADPAMQFTEPQVNHYIRQLFCGLKYCHDHQVLHRDLKGSDLLVDNNGVLKIADFGSASFFDFIHEHSMTNRVTTYWYRAPELLLGATKYGVGVDLWSAGCILAELLSKGPILAGHTEAEQLQKIYALCGSPSEEYWETYKLPLETLYKPQFHSRRCLTETFKDFPPSSLSLLDDLLSVDPAKRPSAASALESKFLSEISRADESQSTKMEYTSSSTRTTTSTMLGKQKDRCNYCASAFRTSMLMRHMKSCASNPSNQPQNQLTLTVAATKVEDTDKTKAGLLAWRFDQQVAKKAIIEMIIRDKLPFKFVENEGFRRCMELCQPALVIPSTSTITRDFYELFLDEKAKLKAQLKQLTGRVCLTIDTWTSLQGNNHLCLTAHFIDNDWRLQKKVLNFCPISSLRGVDIGRVFEVCLVDWGLEHIFTVTVDNASSNDTAIKYIKRRCKRNLCVLKGKWTHVRCMTRVMNLVVQDMIRKMDGSVDGVRAIVRYVTQSPAALEKFKEFAKLENFECQKSLCLDVPTRWNTTYFMLSVAIVYERAFDMLAVEDLVYKSDLGERPRVPSSFDWDNVKRLVGFLQHYYQFTSKVSGTKYTTSNTFLDSVSCIHRALKECFSSEDHVLMEMSSRMKRKLDKYWGEINKFNLLLFIASVFDPRIKFTYLEVTLCNMYGDENGRNISTLCKSALYELFNDYKGIYSDDRVRNMPSSSHQSSTSLGRSLPDVDLFDNSNDVIKALRDNNLAEVKKREAQSGVTNDPKLELDRYLTEEIEEDDEYFQSEDFTVLDWWKRRSTTFPILSLVARDVLAIPASTVACEYSFTTKGRVLDSFGTSLTPESIQGLICYQDWMRSSDVPVNVEEHIRELDNFDDGMGET